MATNTKKTKSVLDAVKKAASTTATTAVRNGSTGPGSTTAKPKSASSTAKGVSSSMSTQKPKTTTTTTTTPRYDGSRSRAARGASGSIYSIVPQTTTPKKEDYTSLTGAELDTKIDQFKKYLEDSQKKERNSASYILSAGFIRDKEEKAKQNEYKDEIARLEEAKWFNERRDKYDTIALNDNAAATRQDLLANGLYNNQYRMVMGMASDSEYEQGAVNDPTNWASAQKAYSVGSFMTDEQRKRYSQIYNTMGASAANDYLDYLSYDLNAQLQADVKKRQDEQFAKKYSKDYVADTGFKWFDDTMETVAKLPWNTGKFIEKSVMNLSSGAGALNAVGQYVDKLGDPNRPIDFNAPAFAMHTGSQAIAQNQTKDSTKTGQFVYNTLSSMVDSLGVMGLTAAGIPFATWLLGGSAATDTMLTAKDRGATDGQAVALGLLSGAAEAIFEEASLEKLFTAGTPANFLQLVENVGKQMGTEGSEELFTGIANFLLDNGIMGKRSELNQAIAEYEAAGYSHKEAQKKAWLGVVEELGLETFAGAISGGLFGMGGQAIRGLSYRSNLNSIENATTTGEAVDAFEQMEARLMDENGEISKDNTASYKKALAAYEEKMKSLSGLSLAYEETNRLLERAEEEGSVDSRYANMVRLNLLSKEAENEGTREAANAKIQEVSETLNKQAAEALGLDIDEIEENKKKFAKNIETLSTSKNLISSAKSFVDNYDGLSTPTKYFDAWRYYEQQGTLSRGNKNDFNETWESDTRFAQDISRSAAIVAYSAGRTVQVTPQVTKTVQTQGTGKVTFSGNSAQILQSRGLNAKNVETTFNNLAGRTGLTIVFDDTLPNDTNGSFSASNMTMRINPNSNALTTFVHEGGHFIQRFAAKEYNEMKRDLLTWFAQENGMRNTDALINAYQDKYSGKSREALEVEAFNDAMASLFNREDGAKQLAEWSTKNLSEEEAKSFKQKILDWIDTIINTLKALVDTKNGPAPQRGTINMEIKQVQAFRQAFLDALDVATQNAQTTGQYVVDEYATPEEASGHDYSIKTLVEGLGYELDEDGQTILDYDGEKLTKATEDHIKKSGLGRLIKYALDNGRIDQKMYDSEIKMFTDLLNLSIERNDSIMMYWEIAGTYVFSAMKDNSDKQYGLTLDMTTICAKTKAIVDVMSEMMMKKGGGLTREEIETAYYETGKAGEPTPCPMCYVFSRWFGIGGLLGDIGDFQNEYGDWGQKKSVAFANRTREALLEFKDQQAKGKQKEYWSKKEGVWKWGKIASDYKSKLNSRNDSIRKSFAASDDIAAQIVEKEAVLDSVDEKTAKSLRKEVGKLRKSAKYLTEEQKTELNKEIADNEKRKREVEAWQWMIKTKLNMNAKTGEFTFNEKYEPVPPEILFDLNKGAEFAERYPDTWAYRTGKGSAMGKAITPYADVRVGEVAQAMKAGKVGDIKITRPDGTVVNPFDLSSEKAIKEQKRILDGAALKAAVQNLIGGMRFQSTSDFRYEYGSDYLMACVELQAIGSNVQLYTKVIEAVDFLASMNADVNMSAMPLGDGWYMGEDGKRHLMSSSVTGINFEAALAMARKYDNAQIIMVGINRNHILTCIEGDEVTFVIPFHGSGQNTKQIAYLMSMLRENLDVTKARDYTDYQTDIDLIRDDSEDSKKKWHGPKPEVDAAEMRKLRKDILTGKLGKFDNKTRTYVLNELTDEQKRLMNKSKYLGNLYERFYLDENAREYGLSLKSDVADQIFPYEYWDKNGTYATADDNGRRFSEYCAELGYMPRFSGYNSKDGKYNEEFDFYLNGEQRGYWKLLIDRSMYENTYDENGNWTGYGKYREQKAINVSNFNVDTIDPRWQTATYGDVMGAKNHTEKAPIIAEAALRDIEAGLVYDIKTDKLVPKEQASYTRETQDGVDLSLAVRDYEQYKDQIGDARGVNIRGRDIMEKILSDDPSVAKTVETREVGQGKYNGQMRRQVGNRVGLVLVGEEGGAKLTGMADIVDEVYYPNRNAFEADFDRHRIPVDDPEFGWHEGREKYGYVLDNVRPIMNGNERVELPVDRKGDARSTRQLTPDINYSRRVTDEEYMAAVEANDMETAARMVEDAAREAGYGDAIPEQTLAYKVRTTKPPTKTKKVYKVFTLDTNGNPTALFVSSAETLPQNVWLDAQDTWHFEDRHNGHFYVPSTQNPYTEGGKTGSPIHLSDISEEDKAELEKRGFIHRGEDGKYTAKDITALAYRPGWHAGDLPFFPQGGKGVPGSTYGNIHRYNQAVFECEIAADVDYTSYSYTKEGKVRFKDRQELPTNGLYKYSTNPMTQSQDLGAWYISDSLKIIRALTEEECNAILKENGRLPQEWQVYQDKEYKGTLKGKQKKQFENTFGPLDLSRLGYTGQQYDAARKTLAPITYDDDGNVIPLSERFNPEIDDVRYSRGDTTSLTKEEQRTLEKRVREAERLAQKESERAERYKSEMQTTPKFTPDQKQTADLANTLVGDENADTKSVEKTLKEIFWNTNMANETGERRYSNRAYALALNLASEIVDNYMLAGNTDTSVAGKASRSELVALKTSEILNSVLQSKIAKDTKADRWAEKLEAVKEELKQTKATLRKTESYAVRSDRTNEQTIDRLTKELAATKQQMTDRLAIAKNRSDARLAFQRQMYNQRLNQQMDSYENRINDLREAREVERLRPIVDKKVKRLRDMMLKPSEKEMRYVPDYVKGAVADYLAGIDFLSERLLNTGWRRTPGDARELTRLDALRKIAEDSKLTDAGEDVESDFYLDLPSYTVDLLNALQTSINALVGAKPAGNVHMNASTSETLRIINELTQSIMTAIHNINVSYANARGRSISDMALDTYRYLADVNKSQWGTTGLGKSLLWSMATPYYAFKRFGQGGQDVFTGLMAGQAKFALNVRQIHEFLGTDEKNEENKLFTRDEQREWSRQVVELDATDMYGNEIKVPMTATQLMSLYALSRREAAWGHLYQGGVEIAQYNIGNKTIVPASNGAVHITPETLEEAFYGQNSLLSDRQKEVTQKLQEFLSTTASDWGNEVTMRRWGVKNFNEQYYFPMKTSDAGRTVNKVSDDNSQSLYALANSGFTKALLPGANNALVIGDVFHVFTDHATDMAKYNALVLPMLDAMRWFNWHQRSESTAKDGSTVFNDYGVKSQIKTAFGGGATAYFRQFMSDLNSAQMEGGAGYSIGSRLMSNYKAAAVAANLRVALLQPTSYFRAAMIIDPQYLAKGAAMTGGVKEMDQYSGIWKWKDMGFYDADVGRSVRRQIQGEDTKAKEVKNKLVDAAMWGAETGDKITWGALWNACKLEQKAQNPGVSYEELMKLTDARFTEVVFATQVFDSAMSRSEVMRKKDPYHKMITAFMSEPTLSYNMVLDKFLQYSIDKQKMGGKKAWQKNGREITRSLLVYSATNLAAALAESIMDAFRDDDDDPWLDKFMDKLLGDWSEATDVVSGIKSLYSGNYMSDMTVLGKIPLIKEVVSLAQGFDIGKRMDTQAWQSIVNTLAVLYEKYNLMTGKMDKATKTTWYGNMTDYGVIYKSMQALSQFSGIPASNVMRDIAPFFNMTIGKLIGKEFVTYESARKRKAKEVGLTEEEMKYLNGTELASDDVEMYAQKTNSGLGTTPRDAGIPIDVFFGFKAKKKEAGATKKEPICDIINEMDISNEMKDLLYYYSGYAASKIEEAPWHQ